MRLLFFRPPIDSSPQPQVNMSTQAAKSTLLTHRSPQEGLKLLELPPELADVLSSDEAPRYCPLPLHRLPSSRHVPTSKTRLG